MKHRGWVHSPKLWSENTRAVEGQLQRKRQLRFSVTRHLVSFKTSTRLLIYSDGDLKRKGNGFVILAILKFCCSSALQNPLSSPIFFICVGIWAETAVNPRFPFLQFGDGKTREGRSVSLRGATNKPTKIWGWHFLGRQVSGGGEGVTKQWMTVGGDDDVPSEMVFWQGSWEWAWP